MMIMRKMKYRQNGTFFLVIFILYLFLSPVPVLGKTNLILGLEISGHLIPYFGISEKVGIREAGINLGMVLPHDPINSGISDFGSQGTIYYRYDFINSNYYPRFQIKALLPPAEVGKSDFLLMVGGGLQYLDSFRGNRFGGGLELNLGLPVSALDRFSGPILYLSLESCYRFE